ncbi:hypothetical protein NJB1907f44_42420 [Mycobacterium marinum]|uniref:hypothetical protein n=1 Tax=Mycobacterium marinum TaxID=1781 RepID=UPI000358B57C|nr:hypothetical protein [Mycobacterium marinum]AXN43242.1 hypothetical protein MM1218R_01292 [Mycobacterium marinum]AXN48703.1 hypothetical protein CCUG20998_01284 [Mycobacterium marinum]EPQ70541.1 hypothetical protein MMEU_4980 [Mycobacterium marinum str. Europe]RFZ11705.1 hypothetical protein DE4381_01295 [Mycobacterium marinum]RFZ12748.1 hypothetical protein VIMS_03143 [Mycobacterium marinum]
MTKELVIDSSRLKIAGSDLAELTLPTPPPPIVATGLDSASAAINAILPIIESPVADSLPVVNSALTKTGSNFVAAAAIYAEADQSLGEQLGQVQFRSAATTSEYAVRGNALMAGSAALGYGLAAEPEIPIASRFTLPTMAQMGSLPGQAATLSGHASQYANLVNQTMGQLQGVASMAQQGPGTAPEPAEDGPVLQLEH